MVPGDFDAIHRMGQSAIQLGRQDEARQLLEGALNMRPDHAEAWMHHGMALQHLGQTDKAIASYNHALSLQPNYPEALYCVAVTQKDGGQFERALESFNRLIGMRGDVPGAFLLRGDLLRQRGDAGGALADYEFGAGHRARFF